MAIQDDNTILMKSDLKAYHEAIAPMLGGNFMMSTNVSDYYYTDETMVGVYTDGKPVYQRSYTFGNVEAGTQDSQGNITSVIARSLNTWKIDKIVYVSGCATASNGNKIAIPYTQEAGKNAFTIGAVCWEASTEKIIFTNSSTYALSDVTVNVRYTKSTDTANSAITTPGAYDLNRPDLWPANKEIFFGNGAYGYRATGTFNTTTDTRESTLLLSLTRTSTTKFISQGGTIKRSVVSPTSSDITIGSPFVSYNLANGIASTPFYAVSIEADGIKLWRRDATMSNIPYDIWITYTK